jgi:hypothetical protein
MKHLIKFKNGELARQKWSKNIPNNITAKIDNFNKICENNFQEIAQIILDDNDKRQCGLNVKIINNKLWNTKKEHIYIITRNEFIIKIGGTRDGMKGRWASYCCGYYVQERKKKDGTNYPGKMSVTNAHLYHTIENDLLNNNSIWKFYIWNLPITEYKITILGKEKNIVAQTFHCYETCCIEKFKETYGKLPLFSDNYDKNYI